MRTKTKEKQFFFQNIYFQICVKNSAKLFTTKNLQFDRIQLYVLMIVMKKRAVE